MNLAVQISVDSSVVEYLPSKQVARVRFPVDAHSFFCSHSCIRHLGREVKAADSKSAGLCPREFESHRCRASMAQLAERSAVNRQVPGSIPGGGDFLCQKWVNILLF